MGQYFEEQPAAESDPDVVELTVGDRRLALVTDAGVFSRHRLDRGTEVLLRKAPPPPVEGVLLDLGCGYGPIACALAVQSPDAWVWAVDVNERARELAARNATEHGLSNITVVGPDEMPDDVQFDAIYSNPPVRIGKDAMFELLTHWLGRLVPHEENPLERAERSAGGGRAFLVVQRHLGADSLQTQLQRDGYLTERLASSKGYRVLVVAGRVTARFSDDPMARHTALGRHLPPSGRQDP
ncbi:MAG: class I SAM-dependent methyltransferase [Acidimicrobiia bacterium]